MKKLFTFLAGVMLLCSCHTKSYDVSFVTGKDHDDTISVNVDKAIWLWQDDAKFYVQQDYIGQEKDSIYVWTLFVRPLTPAVTTVYISTSPIEIIELKNVD